MPLLVTTLDSPAWRETSHGAKLLFVALKRRGQNGRNRAYLSYRVAERELKSSRRKIREWFAELEHYGFIVLAVPGSLGVDGRGKAPHWRLTELGNTSWASAGGMFEPPTSDFLKWDGTIFDPKPFRQGTAWDRKQNPGAHVVTTLESTSSPPPFPTSSTLKSQSGAHVVAMEGDESGAHVVNITRFTTRGAHGADPTPASNSTATAGQTSVGSRKARRRAL